MGKYENPINNKNLATYEQKMPKEALYGLPPKARIIHSFFKSSESQPKRQICDLKRHPNTSVRFNSIVRVNGV